MKLFTTILAAFTLTGGIAFAADEKPAADKPKRDPEAAFKKLDADANGSVTLEEFLAGPAGKRDADKAKQNFARRDKDGDKALTLEEFKAAQGKKADK